MATQAELEQVRRALNRLSVAAQSEMQAIWDGMKTSDRVIVSRALTEGWQWVLERYGNMAATLAADFFEVEASGLSLKPKVQLAPPVNGPRANARLGWAVSTPDQNANMLGLLDELVKQPYRSTFQDSAHASGGAWARVPSGSVTCAWCLMLASRGGIYHSSDLAKFGTNGKKYHGHCVVEGTLVHGPAVNVALRRKYEGRVVTLTTAAGHDLTVTPNHPVLTGRGWVAAGELNEGDDLLTALRAEGHVVGGPHEYGTPARVEDRLSALRMVRTARWGRVPGAPEQFHGDGEDSEVDVVARNGLFWDEVQASFHEPTTEADFALTPGDLTGFSPALDGDGASEVLRGLPVGSSDRRMGSGGLGAPLIGGHPTGSGESGGAASSGLDARLDEPSAHGAAGHSAVIGEGQFALAGEVAGGDTFRHLVDSGAAMPDRLLRMHWGSYSGHVYNFSTEGGWYFANSIVTHNCDCQPVLVRGPQDYPKGYDPGGLADMYRQARKDAESGSPKAILAAMRSGFDIAH